MDEVPGHTATKNMLIYWLNDKVKNKVVVERGIITLYRMERKEHFPGGVWSARYLCQFIQYVAKKLTDVDFVKEKKRAVLFRDSFCTPEWLWKAVAVCGLKLMEDCYKRDALKSEVAKGYLSLTFRTRQQYEDIGKIIGRCTKNHDISPELQRELREIHERSLKQALKTQLQIALNHQEHLIFKKWEPKIREGILLIPEEVKEKLLPATGTCSLYEVTL